MTESCAHPAITDPADLSDAAVRAASVRWLERAVIGAQLCPFAKAVHVRQQVRWVVSAATDAQALMDDLVRELKYLADTDPAEVETTLLVHPHVLADFLDYNDFLDLADAAVEELQLDGELQVASFHPDYQFADTLADDLGNFSNRSPYPTLHLLRESSIDQAVAAFPDTDQLAQRNVERLRTLGIEGWRALFA